MAGVFLGCFALLLAPSVPSGRARCRSERLLAGGYGMGGADGGRGESVRGRKSLENFAARPDFPELLFEARHRKSHLSTLGDIHISSRSTKPAKGTLNT